jgi:hypothetical protein
VLLIAAVLVDRRRPMSADARRRPVFADAESDREFIKSASSSAETLFSRYLYSPSFSFCDQMIQRQPSLSSTPKTYVTFGIVVNVIRPVSLSPCSRLPDFSLSEKEIALLSLSACPLYPLKTGVSNTNDRKKYDRVTARVKNRPMDTHR